MSGALYEMIDISEHNVRGKKPIDWAAVKASGIRAVMIRIGWAGYDGRIAANNGLDSSLDKSVRDASAAGLDVGLYVYTYTKTPEAARIAARECVEIARRYPKMITFPIAFDVEETKLDCLTAQGKTGLAASIAAFCDEVMKQGYFSCWYTYTAFARQYLDLAALSAYELWIADYRKDERLLQSQLGRGYGMWQYLGDEGRCPGVDGACDRNYVYHDYAGQIKKAGLNGWKSEQTAAPPSKPVVTAPTVPEKQPAQTVARAEYDALLALYQAAKGKAEKYERILTILSEK